MMKDKQDESSRQIQIQIEPEVEKGRYFNVATILHRETEFLLDFGLALPGKPAIRVVSRVITHPTHAKQFLLTLQENIRRYEERFGAIPLPEGPIHGIAPDKIN